MSWFQDQMFSPYYIHKSLIILTILLSSAVSAEYAPVSPSEQEHRLIDQRVQSIKKDALEILSEIEQLERRWAYPMETHFIVFSGFAEPVAYRLLSLTVTMDDALVDAYLYSERELDAMVNGGVHRLTEGNIIQGEHELIIEARIELDGGIVRTETTSLKFEKGERQQRFHIELHPLREKQSVIVVEEY